MIRRTVARSAPRRTAAAVTGLSRWTPEGTTNLVQTLEGRRTRRGVWIKVRLATPPVNRTGWVPRKALSDWKEVRTRLVVDRRRLTATLFRRGKVAFQAPVGVGLPRWPTPRGEFCVRNQLYGFGSPVYGPICLRDERALGGVHGLAPAEASSASMGRTSRTSCPAACLTAASA